MLMACSLLSGTDLSSAKAVGGNQVGGQDQSVAGLLIDSLTIGDAGRPWLYERPLLVSHVGDIQSGTRKPQGACSCLETDTLGMQLQYLVAIWYNCLTAYRLRPTVEIAPACRLYKHFSRRSAASSHDLSIVTTYR